uniref:Uncharacterized protein n=1 Tax=Magnetococcus massalia (strain MO-1) TaxID=451514 RepID=A0A1S7LLR5_MAGMO|nr:conserved exported protein of unknown function [Candidatus Magnetococcus massalia]
MRNTLSLLSFFCSLILFTLSTSPTLAENTPPASDLIPFSADVMQQSHQGRAAKQGSIRVSPWGVRSEGQGQQGAQILIARSDLEKQWILIPAQKHYLEFPLSGPIRPPLPHEAGSPCKQDRSYRCTPLRHEMASGRLTQRWRIDRIIKGQLHRHATLWIDEQLKIAIRERYKDGTTIYLSSIKTADQPMKFFEIPTGYKKVEKKPE